MKKSTKIIILAVAIILLLIIIGTVLTFMGVFKLANKTKTPITTDNFITTMENKEFIVTDTKSTQFASYDYISKAVLALSSDYSYKIEFYELTDATYANSFYASNKALLESSVGNVVKMDIEQNGKNFGKFVLSANGKYSTVSRIDNTVIYVNCDEGSKDAVESILKELGY